MELEFDKEIDALIRGRGALVSDSPPKNHLDADEVAAFAENALPERARTLHMAHIADCDRCRKILSDLIAINAEAEPEKVAAAVPALAPDAAAVPWYRKLLLFPNLAYVMGGLVLVMGGLIGLSVLQGSLGDAAVTTSQVTENEQLRGPMAATEPEFSAPADTAANTATAASNTVTTTTTNANAPAGVPAISTNASSAATASTANPADNEVAAARPDLSTADAASGDAPAPTAKPAQPVAAPPPPLAEAAPQKDAAKEEDMRARTVQESEKKKSVPLNARKVENLPLDALPAQNRARTQAGGVAKAAPGPTRDMQQTFPNRADNTYELKSRRVGGRDFQFRSGAWYDTAFRGQGTTNVRRGSEDYRKLDGGLRSIAESLSGVVVVVWGGKAYRIQ